MKIFNLLFKKKQKKAKKIKQQAIQNKITRLIRFYFDRLKILISVFLTLIVGVAIFTDVKIPFAQSLYQEFLVISQKSNLKLEHIKISGRNRVNSQALLKSINLKKNQPILEINVQDIKNELLKINWIKTAHVQRQLPNTLQISIIERIPIAIWQDSDKKYYAIDNSGYKIPIHSRKDFQALKFITGKDAFLHCSEIISELRKHRNLYKKIKALSYIRERRWNLYLDNNLIVKLPAKQYQKDLEKIEKLLNNNKDTFNKLIIEEMDFRVKAKIFIKVKPQYVEKLKQKNLSNT